MSKFSVLIADDHQLVRDAVAHYLTEAEDLTLQVVDSFPDALDAIASAGGFDIVLLDVRMPGMEGLPTVEQAIEANASGAVVLFSGSVRRLFVEAAIAKGVRGYIPKTLPARSLVHALRHVLSGKIYLPPSFMSTVKGGLPEELRHLTPQEGRVLVRLCEGMSNKEIAREMDLSEVTIKTHMRTLCKKLGAKNRTHAAMIATPFLSD